MITVVKQIVDGSKTLFAAKSNKDFVNQVKKAFDLYVATKYNDNDTILGQIKEILKKNNISTDKLEICHNPDGTMVVFYGMDKSGKHKNFFHINTCTFGTYQVNSAESPCTYMVMFDYVDLKSKKNIYIGMNITKVKRSDNIESVSYKTFNYDGIGSPVFIANKCAEMTNDEFINFLKNGTKQYGTNNKQAKCTE
jgi:hypothetical protein